MDEKNEDSFFKVEENIEKIKRKLSNIHHQNQSTEIMASEDVFMNQKEEIKKIKKQRLELKFRESYKERINLKSIKINKDKNYSSYKAYNTISSHSSNYNKNKENTIKKSNSIDNKILKTKIQKNTDKNNIKKIKIKLKDDKTENNKDNNNENNDDKINKEYNNNYDEIDINFDSDIIINNDSENITIKNTENEIDFLSLSNIDAFEKCECELRGDDENDNDESCLPMINEKWLNLTEFLSINDIITNFEFSKKVLKTKNYIDYSNKGIEINIHLKLFAQSSFYIFTRCYIDDYDDTYNNTINNSDEIKKYNTEYVYSISKSKNNQMFSKYSTVIKIYKNKNSKKAFVSFGTFYRSRKSGNLHYKTFLQRQLVDYMHQDNNYYYLENDLCEFDIIVIDIGNENLETKISLNNRDKFNHIRSNFYLPLNKRAKLMFCGVGDSNKVTDLKIRSFSKYEEERDKSGLILSAEKKSCDCCLII